MRIVSILSKLFKAVGILAVRLDLAELRWKNPKKCRIFDKNSEYFGKRLIFLENYKQET